MVSKTRVAIIAQLIVLLKKTKHFKGHQMRGGGGSKHLELGKLLIIKIQIVTKGGGGY